MKLDFLKRGLVNTANFVPTYAIGEINMHPMALGVNLLGRLLSIYLCFQFNEDLDIKSLIISILFPTLYIMYIIADKGIDDVLDKFDLETTDFTEIFDSDSEKCVERKGKDGDLKSVPEDKTRCESVRGGRPNSKMDCESITESRSPISGDAKKRNDAGVCKYIGGGDTIRCSDIKYQSACDGSKYGCSWNNFDLTEDESRDLCYDYSKKTDVSLSECPNVCPYYLKGTPVFKVSKGTHLHHIYLSVPAISSATAAVNPSYLGETSANNTYEWTISGVSSIADQADSITSSAVTATETAIAQPGGRSLKTKFPQHNNWSEDAYTPFNNSAYIVVEFDASAAGNRFYPIFNTDYRGETIQLNFLDDEGSTRRTLSGKVVTIVPSAGASTLTTAYAANLVENHVFSKPVEIAGGNRQSGVYLVVIRPNDLREFYNSHIKELATDTAGGDAKENIYGVTQTNSYEIQAVIISDENDVAHCGKVWGDYKAEDASNHAVDHSIATTNSYEADMKLDHIYWKTSPATSDFAQFGVSDASFTGQFKGSCQ